MASKKGTGRRTLARRSSGREPGEAPERGARRLLASPETVSAGPPQAPEMYMPSNPTADGEAAAGLLAFFATGDALQASDPKAWPEWVMALLERKLAERYDTVKNHSDKKWGTRVAKAQAHVSKWKTTKP